MLIKPHIVAQAEPVRFFLMAFIFPLSGNRRRDNNEESEHLLNQLFGAWKDVDEDLAKEIKEGRNYSDREINFD